MFLINSAGQKLGACGDGIGCSDRTAPNCDQEDKDWGSDRTGLIGTCIPESSDFSSVVFGNGKCRKGIVWMIIAFAAFYISLSYDIVSGSDRTTCIKIDKFTNW